MRIKANISLLGVVILWGTGFVTQGVAAENHLAYLFNGASFILATVVLILFLPKGNILNSEAYKWILIAGLVLFLASAFQQVGIYYTKIGNAGFLTSLYIVFTPLLLWLGFKEKPRWVDSLSVLGACTGVYLLSTTGSMHLQPGDGLEIL